MALNESLNTLIILTNAMCCDLERFIEHPEKFNAAEYFDDVYTAASDAHRLVMDIQALIHNTQTG
jgi:hypothetical protein